MQLYINGKPAAIKAGTTIDLTVENPLFSRSEGYTLEITLPLNGCQENISIFGHLHRLDQIDQLQDHEYPAELVHPCFRRTGIVKIIEVTEAEVTVQFLDGLAAANASNVLDSTYIDELRLYPPDPRPYLIENEMRAWQEGFGFDQNRYWYVFPWVNNTTGNPQNTDPKRWIGRTGDVQETYSWQVNLLHLTRQLLQQAGYQTNLTEWEQHPLFRHLVSMNSLPAAWEIDNYCAALPHWTIGEYLQELERMIGGTFALNTDNQAQPLITFRFFNTTFRKGEYYQPNRIYRAHHAKLQTADTNKPYQQSIIQFAQTSLPCAKYDFFQITPDFLKTQWIVERDRLDEIPSHYSGNADTQPPIYHLRGTDYYYIVYIDSVLGDTPDTLRIEGTILPLGYHATPDTDYETEESRITPIPFMHTADGLYLPYLEAGEYDNEEKNITADNPKSTAQSIVENGKKDYTSPYDNLFVALFPASRYRRLNADGTERDAPYDYNFVSTKASFAPLVGIGDEPFIYHGDQTADFQLCTLFHPETHFDITRADIPQVDMTKEVQIDFMARTLPPIDCLWEMHGKQYLCKQIQLTIPTARTEPTPNAQLSIRATLTPITD